MAVCRFMQIVEMPLLIEFDIGNASGKGILQLLFFQISLMDVRVAFINNEFHVFSKRAYR